MMRACKGPDLVLFADDIDIFAEGSNPAELFERVNRGLMELSRWFRCNRLALNQEDGVCLFCWGPSLGGIKIRGRRDKKDRRGPLFGCLGR